MWRQREAKGWREQQRGLNYQTSCYMIFINLNTTPPRCASLIPFLCVSPPPPHVLPPVFLLLQSSLAASLNANGRYGNKTLTLADSVNMGINVCVCVYVFKYSHAYLPASTERLRPCLCEIHCAGGLVTKGMAIEITETGSLIVNTPGILLLPASLS